MENHRRPNHNNRYPVRDSNRTPPEYKSAALRVDDPVRTHIEIQQHVEQLLGCMEISFMAFFKPGFIANQYG
jgi:hypothetical protein